MKVLFVCSGRNSFISPIVKSQGESLKKAGVDLSYFSIRGRGFSGYFRSIFSLRKEIHRINPDVVHAHYSLCCIVAAFATSKPVVASLMGSDLVVNRLFLGIIRFFSKYRWKATIVKSKGMKDQIRLDHVHILPNGVDLSFFRPLDQAECKKRVGFDPLKKQILFMADPARYVKNFDLARNAFEILQKNSIEDLELKAVHGVDHGETLYFINAADVVLLTSRWEGSPNIIKESMACNAPIVSTKVGDVEEITGATPGCFLGDPSPGDIATALGQALEFNKRTNGRDHISHLDSELIARKIITIYEEITK